MYSRFSSPRYLQRFSNDASSVQDVVVFIDADRAGAQRAKRGQGTVQVFVETCDRKRGQVACVCYRRSEAGTQRDDSADNEDMQAGRNRA